MKNKLLNFSSILIASSINTSVLADEISGIHPLLSDSFTFSAGLADFNLDGTVRSGENGSDIHLQDDLGYGTSETLWSLGFKWRITEKSHVSLSYFNIQQENQTTSSKTINWGDLQFDAGTAIGSNFDLSVLRAFYGYSLYKTEQAEFGIGGGFHFMDLETQLAGQASINNASKSFKVQTSDVSVPLPNLGIYGAYAFTSKWYVNAYADWLAVDIDEFDGYLVGGGINLQYQAFKNAGIGLGYQYFETNYDVDTSNWTGNIDYTYSGPSAFMTINF